MMLTARDGADDRVECFDSVADYYLAKTLERAECLQ